MISCQAWRSSPSPRRLLLAVLASFLFLSAPKPSQAQLSELIKKAAEEKEVVFQIPEPKGKYSTAHAEQQMADLVRKKFGVNVRIKFTFALGFPAAAARALTEIKTGSYPSYDLMYQNTGSGIGLYRENVIQPVRWRELFKWITEKEITYGGRALAIETAFILPMYNTNLVKPAEVPKTWEDLLDPTWKGKLATTIYQNMWPIMAQPAVWGEAKTKEFLTKLALQNPVLGRFPEIEAKVISGELSLTAVSQTDDVAHYVAKGAPVTSAIVEPVMVFVRVVLVPQKARHPNAATLLAASLLTPEGQAILTAGWGGSSLFQPNTATAKFAAGKRIALPDVDFEKEKSLSLQKEYEQILVRR